MRDFSSRVHLFLVCILVTLLGGCAAYGGVASSPQHHPPHREDHYGIPKGHMPPPGECRIWFRDRPPGQQPPPGDCYDLEQVVPRDAILVRG